VRYGL